MIPQCLWSFCIIWCFKTPNFMDMKLVSLQKNWRICDVPLHLLSLKSRVDKKILRTHKIPIWQSFYDIVISQYFIWAEHFFLISNVLSIPVSSSSCCLLSVLTKAQCLIWHYKLHQNLLGFLSKSKISEKIPSMFWRVFWCPHSCFCY